MEKSNKTKDMIISHVSRVRKHLDVIIRLLYNRKLMHDASKLSEEELPIWEKMDSEPRYEYGSPEYFDKIKRYKKVFDIHYKKNRHHPEHYPEGVWNMTIIDIIEMMCDWLGYRDSLSYTDAIKIVAEQMFRYKIINQEEYEQTLSNPIILKKEDPNILKIVILNTLKRYFSRLGNLEEFTPEGIEEEIINEGIELKKKSSFTKGKIIDLSV